MVNGNWLTVIGKWYSVSGFGKGNLTLRPDIGCQSKTSIEPQRIWRGFANNSFVVSVRTGMKFKIFFCPFGKTGWGLSLISPHYVFDFRY
jgi:hypothetical protein